MRIHNLRTIRQEIVSLFFTAFILGVIAALLLFVFDRPYVGALFAFCAWLCVAYTFSADHDDDDDDDVDVDVAVDDDDAASGDHR